MDKKRLTKGMVLALVALALAALAIRTVKMRKEALGRDALPRTVPVVVKAAPVEVGVFPVGNNYLGTVRAKVEALISPRVEARILELKPREGDHVKKGEMICLLDDRVEQARVLEIRARLAAAKTELSTQERIYERDKVLFENRALSQEELDISRAKKESIEGVVRALEAELKIALTQLSYTRIEAPFPGVVTKRFKDQGDLAVPGTPILSIEAVDEGYYVEVKVPQEEFKDLKVGNKVRLYLQSKGKGHEVIMARISRIHPSIGVGTLATLEVDVTKRPFGLPTGAVVNVFIEFGNVKGIKIPTTSLLENVGKAYCYFLDDDTRVRIRAVNLLWKGEDFSIVSATTGSVPWKTVVVAQESALLRLHEGDKVRVEDRKVGEGEG